jgi:hypothetical protein
MAVFGDFEYNKQENGIIGPEDYMLQEERLRKLIDNMCDGKDLLFNTISMTEPDWKIAILRRIQIDYTDWKGMHQFAQTYLGE